MAIGRKPRKMPVLDFCEEAKAWNRITLNWHLWWIDELILKNRPFLMTIFLSCYIFKALFSFYVWQKVINFCHQTSEHVTTFCTFLFPKVLFDIRKLFSVGIKNHGRDSEAAIAWKINPPNFLKKHQQELRLQFKKGCRR